MQLVLLAGVEVLVGVVEGGGVRGGGRAGVRRVVRADVRVVRDGGHAGACPVHVVWAGVRAGGHHG